MSTDIQTVASSFGVVAPRGSGTQFDVGRLQRGLQLIKEEVNGQWRPVSGVTYEKDLTCVWDAYTDSRAEAAARFLEEQRAEHSTLACWTYDLCDPIHIESIAISTDRRTVWVKPAATWDAVKANMESEIARHGMRPCAAAPTVAAPRPSPSPTVTPPPPATAAATRLYVSALQQVLIKMGYLQSGDYDCTWGPKTERATRTLLMDLTVLAPFEFTLDVAGVFQDGQVVDLKPKGTWDLVEDVVAREIITIDYKPCPARVGTGGSAPLPAPEEVPPEAVEAGAGGGGLLLLAGVLGVGYWLWRKR